MFVKHVRFFFRQSYVPQSSRSSNGWCFNDEETSKKRGNWPIIRKSVAADSVDAEPIAAAQFQLKICGQLVRLPLHHAPGSHSFSDLLYKAPKEVVEEWAEELDEEEEGDEEGETVEVNYSVLQ